MLTLSFMTSAITAWAFPSGGKLEEIQAKFIKPVPLGVTVIAGGTVTEKHPIGNGKSFVVVETWAQNQAGEKLAVGEAEVVLPDLANGLVIPFTFPGNTHNDR